MEVCVSLNPLVRLHMSNSSRPYEEALIKHSLISARTQKPCQHIRQRVFVVKAKGKKGLMSRQFNRPPPPLPKIEDDGNPRFVVFIRMANVSPFLSPLPTPNLSSFLLIRVYEVFIIGVVFAGFHLVYFGS